MANELRRLTDVVAMAQAYDGGIQITNGEVMMKYLQKSLVALLLLLLLALPVQLVSADVVWELPTTNRENETIYDVIDSDPRFSHIAHVVRRAGLQTLLHQHGKFTVFAPTNRAFGNYPAAMIDAAIADADSAKMRQIGLYHIVPGQQSPDVLYDIDTLRTALGEHLTVGERDGQVILNGTSLVRWKRIEAANGTIYVIDTVLVPPSAR